MTARFRRAPSKWKAIHLALSRIAVAWVTTVVMMLLVFYVTDNDALEYVVMGLAVVAMVLLSALAALTIALRSGWLDRSGTAETQVVMVTNVQV
jgi:hypothetical protein